jgi:di/tricarboxylate transporter
MIPRETLHAVLTLVILVGAIYSFVRERLPADLTALLALLALLATRVLSPAEAFAGFSHPATVSVAAMLVLSAGIERTGALAFVARRVLAPFARFEILFTLAIMLAIGALSAFVNNTAAVAVFIPVVLDACRRSGASPGRILMPMAHAATLGGMCTLIGTSTNLVAHEFARSQGLAGFSMFELGKVGLPMLAAGFVYILAVGRLFLPRNRIDEPPIAASVAPYVAELVVPPDSGWIGRELRARDLRRDFDVELLAVARAGANLPHRDRALRLAPGDALRVSGALEQVLRLTARSGMDLHRPAPDPAGEGPSLANGKTAPAPENGPTRSAGQAAAAPRLPLAEVVVLSTSGLVGRTLKEVRFAARYGAVVLALRRRGEVGDRPSTAPLHPGDVLVVEGEPEKLRALTAMPGFLAIGAPAHPEERPEKLAIALATLVAVVAAVALGVAPIVTAATTGCAILMLTGCLRPREAYRAIDMPIVFLLAGALALGQALEKTGLTAALAGALAGTAGATTPYAVLAGFFFAAVLLSEFMSNSGTVALLAPVAVSCGEQMGMNPMALLATVAFGASAAFAMPIGYQTSLMVYGPGGYRCRDFLRLGIVLDAMLALLALVLVPRYWPLVAPPR